jgi:hypothetical protein
MQPRLRLVLERAFIEIVENDDERHRVRPKGVARVFREGEILRQRRSGESYAVDAPFAGEPRIEDFGRALPRIDLMGLDEAVADHHEERRGLLRVIVRDVVVTEIVRPLPALDGEVPA